MIHCIYDKSSLDSICAAALLYSFNRHKVTLYTKKEAEVLGILNSCISPQDVVYILCTEKEQRVFENNQVITCTARIDKKESLTLLIWGLFQKETKRIPIGVELIHLATIFPGHANASLFCLGLLGYNDIYPNSPIWINILHPSSSLTHLDIISKGATIKNYMKNKERIHV